MWGETACKVPKDCLLLILSATSDLFRFDRACSIGDILKYCATAHLHEGRNEDALILKSIDRNGVQSFIETCSKCIFNKTDTKWALDPSVAGVKSLEESAQGSRGVKEMIRALEGKEYCAECAYDRADACYPVRRITPQCQHETSICFTCIREYFACHQTGISMRTSRHTTTLAVDTLTCPECPAILAVEDVQGLVPDKVSEQCV